MPIHQSNAPPLAIFRENGHDQKRHINDDPKQTSHDHDAVLLLEFTQIWLLDSARFPKPQYVDFQGDEQQDVDDCAVEYQHHCVCFVVDLNIVVLVQDVHQQHSDWLVDHSHHTVPFQKFYELYLPIRQTRYLDGVGQPAIVQFADLQEKRLDNERRDNVYPSEGAWERVDVDQRQVLLPHDEAKVDNGAIEQLRKE